MPEQSQRGRAVFMMVICASLWSIAGIFIKLIPWNPLVIAGARSLVAAAVVVVFMRVTRLKLRWCKDALLSGVFLSATFLAFVTANKMTTSANAIVLQFTAPVFLLVLSSVFFKQRFRRADWVAVAITMLGISLFFFDQLTPGHLVGNLIALFSGFSMGAMFVCTGKADESARMTGILLGHLFTAAIGLPMAFVFPTPISVQPILCILALGICQLGIPYVLYGVAVKHCPPLACSLISAIEPLLNPLWVFLFDGERPGLFALLGGAIVLVTISLWCVLGAKRPAADPLPEATGK